MAQMAVAGVKILKPGGVKLDKFEESVSQVCVKGSRDARTDTT